jgi:hypothetical protein
LFISGSLFGYEMPSAPIQDAMREQLLISGLEGNPIWSANQGDGQDRWNSPEDNAKKSESTDTGARNISATKAGLYSALVPGLGEWYLGSKSKARVFFAIDAATWISFISFRVYGNWKEDDFVRFGEVNANASLQDKDDEFLDMVGFYQSIDEYNSFGRVFDPERPFLVDNPDNHWYWTNSEDQATYRHLKNRSREAFRRSEFMLGLAALTRVVSIVDAVISAKRMQRRIDGSFSQDKPGRFDFSVNPMADRNQIRITMYTGF